MKQIKDLIVTKNERIGQRYVRLTLESPDAPLPAIVPGQFVEVSVPHPQVFLRRPISIHDVSADQRQLQLLVAVVGNGTRQMAELKPGDKLNCVLPLGNGFTAPQAGETILMAGGGVGTAPLLYLGRVARQANATPIFLIGAKTKNDLPDLQPYQALGQVHITTEDGTAGEQGFVTQHSLLNHLSVSRIAVCGPKPMMKAVGQYALKNDIPCEVSLENLMACGLGACLCCVEKTKEGHLCVCKEGPVFNINRLTWFD